MLHDPAAVIAQMPPGSAVYARQSIDGGPMEVSFLVREDSSRIQAMGSPLIEIRAAIIYQDAVGLVPVLVRIGEERQENIFETWWNYCASDGSGPGLFRTMASQPRVALCFFGDSRAQERAIEVVNSWGEFFRRAGDILSAMPAWPMAAFDQAREKVYGKYPSVMALWRAVEK